MDLTVFIIENGLPNQEELLGQFNEYGIRVYQGTKWTDFETDPPASVKGHQALIFDLDSEQMGINEVRRFKEKNPEIHLLAVASRSYNPDMAECIEKHLFALLKKPVVFDELQYLLKCISRLQEKH